MSSTAKRTRQMAHDDLESLGIEGVDVDRVRAKVEDTLATAKDSLEEGAASVRERSRQLADKTNGYVRERPWTALGIAAAVGLVLGALSARR